MDEPVAPAPQLSTAERVASVLRRNQEDETIPAPPNFSSSLITNEDLGEEP